MLVGRLLAALPGGRSARRCPGAGGAAAAARPSSKKPETTPMLLVAGASLPTRLVSRVTRDEGACPCRALQRPARLRCWKFQLGTKLVLEQSLRCWNLLSEESGNKPWATSCSLQHSLCYTGLRVLPELGWFLAQESWASFALVLLCVSPRRARD